MQVVAGPEGLDASIASSSNKDLLKLQWASAYYGLLAAVYNHYEELVVNLRVDKTLEASRRPSSC